MLQTTTPTQLFSPLPGQLASDCSPPVFEQIFKNARFAQGGDAFFQGKLRGNPTPEVSWTRKGAPLLESSKHHMSYNPTTGDVSLLIKQIGPGDEGEYTCKVKNTVGEAICSVFIQSEGQPMPQFQQLNHTQNQQHTSQYTNGFSHTTIEEEFKVDIFEYRLLREVSFRESITRRYANESDFKLSTIVDPKLGPASPPQVGQKPRNSKLVEGSDAVFTTKVSSNPKPRLTWFHNGQRITNTEKHETIFSNNQASLRIKSATSTDSGHYTMLAENTQGVIVSSAVLAIEPAQEKPAQIQQSDVPTESADSGKTLGPSFVRVFQDTNSTEGKMARFDCRLTGRPYPDVTWFINGRPAQDDATHKILVNESGNHSLMITNVHRSDAGVITCLARNKGGEVNIQARLNVLEKEQVVAPKFVERFTTVNVKEGEPVALHARVVGTPAPRISWQKDGGPLVPGPDINISIVDGVTTLDILRAKASDAAWYQCTAQNVAGSTATRARIFVETPKTPTLPEQRRLYLPRPTKVIEPE
jgi:titin